MGRSATAKKKKNRARHLPPAGATANVELLSLTNLTFSCDPPSTKNHTSKTSSSQLCYSYQISCIKRKVHPRTDHESPEGDEV